MDQPCVLLVHRPNPCHYAMVINNGDNHVDMGYNLDYDTRDYNSVDNSLLLIVPLLLALVLLFLVLLVLDFLGVEQYKLMLSIATALRTTVSA